MEYEEKSRNISHDEDSELEKHTSKVTESTANENGAPLKWTFKRVVAVISLCLVYVGRLSVLSRISIC